LGPVPPKKIGEKKQGKHPAGAGKQFSGVRGAADEGAGRGQRTKRTGKTGKKRTI